MCSPSVKSFFLYQAEAFPEKLVEVQYSDGSLRQQPFASGDICVGCIDACHNGMPGLPIATICEMCNTNEEFRLKCVDIRNANDAYESGSRNPNITDNVHVTSKVDDGRRLTEVFSGYTRQEFIDAHDSFTPEMLEVPPTIERKTRYGAIELFYLPGLPAPNTASFILEVSRNESVHTDTDLMPRQIYVDQPKDSHILACKEVLQDVPGDRTPTRAMVRTNLKRAHQTKAAGHATSARPRNPVANVVSLVDAKNPSLFERLVKTELATAGSSAASSRPSVGKPKGSDLRHLPVIPKVDPDKCPPPTKPQVEPVEAAGLAQPIGIADPPARGNTPPTNPLEDIRFQMMKQGARPTARRSTRVGVRCMDLVSTPESVRKRPRVKMEDADSSIFETGAVVPLVRLDHDKADRDSNEEKSLTGSILNKYERCMKKAAFSKALAGVNMKEDFTQLKRNITSAETSGEDKWAEELTKHQTYLASFSELVLAIHYFLSTYLPTYLLTYLSTHLPTCLSTT